MPSTKHNGSIPIDHFLKEALQILRHASVAVTAPDNVDVTGHGNYSNDDDKDDRPSNNNTNKDQQAVTWKLNLSPTTMTLDTNIQTIAGLEKVLEQLSVNIQPRPPPLKQPPMISSDEYQMPDYLHSIATALYLSSVFPLPKADIFRQFNSMQLMRQCVQAFVMCDGAIFFHIPRLLAETDLVLTHPAASKEHPIETLLVLSICSLMIRHVMMHKQGPPQIAAGLMHAYYAHARLLLQDLFDTRHISVVQALFMLSVYPQGHVDMFSPSRTRSSLFSVALRLALSMDLHRIDLHNDDNNNEEDNNSTDINENAAESEEKEKLRRFSWMLLCADYFADWNGSGTTGRITVADWHVNFPQPLPDEQQQAAKRVEYLALYSRVVMIRKMHLFRSAYSIVHRSSKGRESSTDEMLFEKYMDTPAPFRLRQDLMDFSKKAWSRSDLEPLLLHTLYYDTLICTHVPFLPKRYLQTLERERSIRESHVKDIFDRISQSSAPAPLPSSSRLPDYASFSSVLNSYGNRSSSSNGSGDGDLSSSAAADAEFHTVVGCLDAACQFTLVLELLLVVDPIGCYHSPVYGALTTAHVYHMLETNSQDADIVHVCRINLVRTFRIIQQARMVHADAVVLYLQRILPQWMAMSTDGPTLRLQLQACETMQALRERAKSKGASIHNSSPDDDSLQVVKTEST